MNNPALTYPIANTGVRRSKRPFAAALGLVVWPLLLLTDTALAIRRGWSLEVAGGFRLIPLASVAFVAVVGIAFCIPFIRRRLGVRWRQCWLFAAGLLVAYLLSAVAVQGVCPQPAFHRRLAHADYRFEPNRSTLAGVSDPAHTRINAQGLRGPELNHNAARLRILCIGGSTTEGLYLDDSEAWPSRLMAELNAPGKPATWVAVTAGGDLATGHHLRFLRTAPIVKRMDCLVVMPGVNDLVRFLLGLSSDDAQPPIWFESGVVEASKQLWNAKLGHGFVWDRSGQSLARHQSERPIPAPASPPAFQRELRAYRARLENIAKAAKIANVRLVFVSQPVLWDDFLSLPAYRLLRFARMLPAPREWDYLRPGNLREAMDEYNDVLSEVCRNEQIEYVDAASTLSGQAQYFYDDYHLNEAGSAALAKLLATWFVEHPQPEPLSENTRLLGDAIAQDIRANLMIHDLVPANIRNSSSIAVSGRRP